MRRPRVWIAAAQAGVSVVLLLVVYLTLLRPDEGDSLFDVAAPQGPGYRVDASFPNRDRERAEQAGVREPATASPGLPETVPPESRQQAAPLGPPDGGFGSLGEQGGDSPTDEQYRDAVTKLLLRVEDAD